MLVYQRVTWGVHCVHQKGRGVHQIWLSQPGKTWQISPSFFEKNKPEPGPII